MAWQTYTLIVYVELLLQRTAYGQPTNSPTTAMLRFRILVNDGMAKKGRSKHRHRLVRQWSVALASDTVSGHHAGRWVCQGCHQAMYIVPDQCHDSFESWQPTAFGWLNVKLA